MINDGPVLCMFRQLTDLSCPGCGFTRSFVATMHGRWSQAHNANLLGIPLMLSMVVWWCYACGCLWKKTWPRAIANWLWALALCVVVGVHLWRSGVFA
ncbi:MAG TPA: hypothetical protein DCQ06_00815 [Myxococcales bacterium]|nr:hypothetical protein [Myxococcales bacterium]